jgi:hypothetical protein
MPPKEENSKVIALTESPDISNTFELPAEAKIFWEGKNVAAIASDPAFMNFLRFTRK